MGFSLRLDWSGWRQSSDGLKFNRYIANKEDNFCTAAVKMQILILTVKEFQGISNLTISGDLHGLLAPEESLSWKNQFPF